MRKELRSRKSAGAYVAPEVELECSNEEHDREEERDEEDEFETAYAITDSGPRKGVARRSSTRVGPGPRYGNWSKTRSTSSRPVCYRYGQLGHYSADCKADVRLTRAASTSTCGLCGDGHSTDRCPQLGAAARLVQQQSAGPSGANATKVEARSDASRKQPPASDATNDVVDDPLEVVETTQAPELQVLDPAMPAVPTPNTSRMRLFFVKSMV